MHKNNKLIFSCLFPYIINRLTGFCFFFSSKKCKKILSKYFCIFSKQKVYIYEVCLKSIGTVCFAQTTLATVIKALFFKMAQCLVVVKM